MFADKTCLVNPRGGGGRVGGVLDSERVGVPIFLSAVPGEKVTHNSKKTNTRFVNIDT